MINISIFADEKNIPINSKKNKNNDFDSVMNL